MFGSVDVTPLKTLEPGLYLLGLSHGPTLAFKDLALQLLGELRALVSTSSLELGIDSRRVAWRRVMDMNDRALRDIASSLGGVANGFDPAIKKDGTVLKEGYIGLQAESQPVEFRNVRLVEPEGNPA